MISSGTFKTFAVAASVGAFVFSPCEVSSAEINPVSVGYKDSLSQNWREYGVLNLMSSAYTENAEIKSVVGLTGAIPLSDFDAEMDGFWSSLEDGSIFESVGVEVWEIAKRIASAKPDIADHI